MWAGVDGVLFFFLDGLTRIRVSPVPRGRGEHAIVSMQLFLDGTGRGYFFFFLNYFSLF